MANIHEYTNINCITKILILGDELSFDMDIPIPHLIVYVSYILEKQRQQGTYMNIYKNVVHDDINTVKQFDMEESSNSFKTAINTSQIEEDLVMATSRLGINKPNNINSLGSFSDLSGI